MPGQPLLFNYWLLSHPVFWFTSIFPTQLAGPPLVTYPSLCSTYMTYRGSYHSIGHQVLPTQPLFRKVDDFPRCDKHSKHVPLLTYLAWLQPAINNSRLIFKHGKTKNIFFVVKTLIKKHKVVVTLINNHFNQLCTTITSFT